MRIKIEKYNPQWTQTFETVKEDLTRLIGNLNVTIEHIGSTSVEGLAAKPIIDILVGLENENDLDKVITPLMDNDYIYYETYNQYLPDRRFFVKHKIKPQTLFLPKIFKANDSVITNTIEHENRLAHIHVWPVISEHWLRHIAFRDYLRNHAAVKNEYQELKEKLSTQEWRDGNEYNEAKNSFIKTEEQKALEWYNSIL